jgi:hypothetical protein
MPIRGEWTRTGLSIITLCFIAMISLYSFLLLVQCSLVIPGSFGGE